MGFLSYVGEVTPSTIRQAIVHGSVLASFAVEDFSVNRLRTLTQQEVVDRNREFREFAYIEECRWP